MKIIWRIKNKLFKSIRVSLVEFYNILKLIPTDMYWDYRRVKDSIKMLIPLEFSNQLGF
jgi:hypothetical protein